MHSINPHLATQKSDGINSGAALLYVSETFSFLTNRSLPFPFLNGTKRYFTLKNPGSMQDSGLHQPFSHLCRSKVIQVIHIHKIGMIGKNYFRRK